MFPCMPSRVVRPQPPRRPRRLPAALLAAALLLAAGAAQAAPGQGRGTAEPAAGLLASAWSWLLSLVAPQDGSATGADTATVTDPTATDGFQVLSSTGDATYDPTSDAGSRMDPNG